MTDSQESVSSGGARRRILDNTLWLTFSSLFAKVLAYIQFLLMVRAFSQEQMGVYAVCLTVVLLAELVANLGVDKVVIRDVARQHSSSLFETSVLLKILTSLGAYVLALGSLYFFYGQDLTVEPLALLSFFAYLPLSAIGRSFESYFTAIERMTIPALSQFLERLVMLVTSGLAWFGLIGFNFFLASFCLAGFVRAIFPCLYYVRERDKGKIHFSPVQARELLNASSWLFVMEVLAVIYFRLDIFMLSKMAGFEATGLYLTAYKLFELGIALFSGYITAIFPSMSRNTDHLSAWNLFGAALTVFLVLTLPGIFWRSEILSLFKPEYMQASQTLLFLLCTLPVLYMNSIFSLFTIVSNQIPRLLKVAVPVLFLNIGLNFFLIPRMGVAGSALATLVGEIVLWLIFLYILDPFTPRSVHSIRKEVAS